MSTLSTSVLNDIAWNWDNASGLSSAVLSGIVGDPDHQASGGYHISIEDQVNSSNYSVILEKDKAPPGWWDRNRAAAIDMSMNPTDMGTMWWRFYALFQNRHTDPRAQYIREAIGLNPTNDRAQRMNFINGTITDASRDHDWHWHLSIFRMFVNNLTAGHGIKSGLKGQSLQGYMNEINPPPPPPPAKKRKKMTEYLVFKPATTATGNHIVWAVERPYHPNPERRWEEFCDNNTPPNAAMANAIGNAGAGGNVGLSAAEFDRRKANYAPGGIWAGPLDGVGPIVSS